MKLGYHFKLIRDLIAVERDDFKPPEFMIRQDGDGNEYIVPRVRTEASLPWFLFKQAL
jgi:hypothetical protein